MDIYAKRSRWKISLAIVGLIIAGFSVFYTNYLANNLRDEEQIKATNWANAMTALTEMDEDDEDFCDYTLHTDIVWSNQTIPVIWVEDSGTIGGADIC